jgi:hypothetical protein
MFLTKVLGKILSQYHKTLPILLRLGLGIQVFFYAQNTINRFYLLCHQ